MKQSFTLLFSLFLVALQLNSQAQPTLTMANTAIAAGETQTFQLVEAESLNQGPAGANVTWNFSNLTLSGASTEETTLAAAGTPYAAQFPTADIAIGSEGSYVYFDLTSSSYSLLGIASADVTSVYSNPETVFVFPFTYGDNHEDDFYATGSLSGSTQYRFGTTTVTGDGYGTLILPSGTYTNVLRIHAVQDSKDSLNVAGFSFTTEFHSDVYAWYAPNVTKGFLFAITNATSTPSVGAPVTQKTAELRVLEGVGIPTLQAEPLNAYPNPTTNQLSVDCPSDLGQTATIKVYDLAGRTVKTATVPQSGRQSILVGDLPSGMYLVTLQSANKVWQQKVSVIH